MRTICKHEKRADRCILCRPHCFCEHGRQNGHCAPCNPCSHGRRKFDCVVCNAERMLCSHGKRKEICALCNPSIQVVRREKRHSFTEDDERRYQQAIVCDWCGNLFNGATPDIDHDHRCCVTREHCRKCLRGFVHHQCNMMIGYYEWLEKTFADTHRDLERYRRRFYKCTP